MWRRITHSVSHGMGRASSSAIASAASAIRPCASIAWVRSAWIIDRYQWSSGSLMSVRASRRARSVAAKSPATVAIQPARNAI